MDSHNVEIIELNGVEDLTVRPLREWFRSLVIKTYCLPAAPSPPQEETRR